MTAPVAVSRVLGPLVHGLPLEQLDVQVRREPQHCELEDSVRRDVEVRRHERRFGTALGAVEFLRSEDLDEEAHRLV
jgi:hypothetical protein